MIPRPDVTNSTLQAIGSSSTRKKPDNRFLSITLVEAWQFFAEPAVRGAEDSKRSNYTIYKFRFHISDEDGAYALTALLISRLRSYSEDW